MSKRGGSALSESTSEHRDKRQDSTSTTGAACTTAVVSTTENDVVRDRATVQSAIQLAIKDANEKGHKTKGWTIGWVGTLDKEGAKHWLVACGKWQPAWANDGVTKRREQLKNVVRASKHVPNGGAGATPPVPAQPAEAIQVKGEEDVIAAATPMLRILNKLPDRLYLPKYHEVLEFCLSTCQQPQFSQLISAQAPPVLLGVASGCTEGEMRANAAQAQGRVTERDPQALPLPNLYGANRNKACTPNWINLISSGQLHRERSKKNGEERRAWMLYPTLMVVAHSLVTKTVTNKENVKGNGQLVVLVLSDGMRTCHATVASYAMNISVARRLKVNDLITLDAYTPAIKECTDDSSALRVNIIIKRFRVVDQATPLPLGQLRQHASTDKCAKILATEEEWRDSCQPVSQPVSQPGDDDDDDGDDDDDDDDSLSVSSLLPGETIVPRDVDTEFYEKLPMPGGVRQFPIKCDGSGCTKYGAIMGRCIALECPPGDFCDEDLIEGYPFFVHPDLTPAMRRTLRYYFYATSIYGARGVGVRIELPHCLVSRIRFEIPNEKDHLYVEHKD